MRARLITERLQWRPSAAERPSSIMLLLAGDITVHRHTKHIPSETVSMSGTCCDTTVGLTFKIILYWSDLFGGGAKKMPFVAN